MRRALLLPTLCPVETPLITVFGATGLLGSGIVRALLQPAPRRFRVRAVTRRPGGRVAQALAALGAETIVADLDDGASLRRALQGAHGAFCRTLGGPRDAAQAQALHDAARAMAVAHVVWWLPAPAQALAGLPVTPLALGFVWDALLRPGMLPLRDAHGRLVLHWPQEVDRLAGISADDGGACVAALFAHGAALRSSPLALAGDALDATALAAGLAKLLREPVQLQLQPMQTLAPAWAEGWRRTAGVDMPGAIGQARQWCPGLRSIAQWLQDPQTLALKQTLAQTLRLARPATDARLAGPSRDGH